MQFANASKLFSNLKALLPLASLLLIALSSTSHANSVTINCTGIGGENETCSIASDGGSASEGMVNLVGDLINAINNNDGNDSSCTRDGNSINCSLVNSDLSLDCEVQTGRLSNTGSCNLNIGDEELNVSLLSLDCSATETDGECLIQNDPEEINEYLETAAGSGVSSNNVSVLRNIAIGCGFQGGTSTFQSDCNNLLSVLDGGSTSQIQALVEAISPTNVDAALDTNVLKTQQLAGTLRGRLARARSGQTGVDTTAVRYFDGNQWIQVGDMLASNQNDTMNDASPTGSSSLLDSEKFGVFIDAAITNTTFDDTDNENEADTDDFTMTIGFDYRLRPNLITGIAFSIATITTEYGNSRGETDTENFTLLGYGSYYQDDWYIDATIGLGGDRYDQKRNINCTVADCGVAIDNTMSADYYGDQTSFTIGGGYDFSFNEWAMTPFVQYASTKVTVDEYEEEAANTTAAGAGYALAIDEQDRDSSTFTLGSDLRYTMSQDWGVLIPYVGLEFISEMDDDAVFVSGRFLGNVSTNEQFELATGEIDSSYFYVSVGASATFTNGGAAFIDVRSLQGYEDTDQVRITGGYRVAF